jgi:hypothetical protein
MPTRDEYIIQALGNYQLAVINSRCEIEQLKEKMFKLEKLAAEVNKAPKNTE